MYLSSKAIVIHRIKYKDNGLIVKLFTEERGMLSFMIRNVNRKKNKLSALYQPLTILNIQSHIKSNVGLHYIKEARIEDPLNQIHQHPIKVGVSMFITEILYKTLKEEEPNEALFHYLVYALHWLEISEVHANFPIAFLINLSKYYGFPPHSSKPEGYPIFDMREGIFRASAPTDHMEYLTKEKSSILHLFLGSNFDTSSAIHMSPKNRKEMLVQMINYFHIHLDHFRSIQSHLVLEETFNVY